MPKYLIHASYTSEGARGLISEGGTGRRDAIARLAEGLGGKLECFYFAFGNDDVVTIIDFPDNESAAAVSMTIGASGLVSIKTTVLLTPEEVDGAGRKSVAYRGPGQ
ncbi:MAG: GYD domain-containing protein [Solirubrobacteraceae bacterium]